MNSNPTRLEKRGNVPRIIQPSTRDIEATTLPTMGARAQYHHMLGADMGLHCSSWRCPTKNQHTISLHYSGLREQARATHMKRWSLHVRATNAIFWGREWKSVENRMNESENWKGFLDIVRLQTGYSKEPWGVQRISTHLNRIKSW